MKRDTVKSPHRSNARKKPKLLRWELPLGDRVGPELLGPNDAHIRYLEQFFASSLTVRGDRLIVTGPSDERTLIETVFRDLIAIVTERREPVASKDVKTALALASNLISSPNQSAAKPVISEPFETTALVPISPLLRKPVEPRSENQRRYLDLIQRHPIVFATGPAGSGKTYLAVAAAVSALLEGAVERIILVRPVVEAGEHLGFLPGDIKEKVDPYFRPIYDALMDMLPAEKLRRFLYTGMIEIAPLAYMRGRTLNNGFVILDEAQNTTSAQMKMFLTRIGRGSRAVVTGDLTQVDLPKGERSGYTEAIELLAGIPGIVHIGMTGDDVVRHSLVVEIVAAYSRQKTLKQE